MSKNNKTPTNYLAFGISLGLCFGALYGLVLNNIALGAGMGLCMGIVIGSSIDRKNKKK
ncbi:glycine zipper family protein [Priestia aryabhattai]|uniref:glycine zipper family protein n=1 Tax=Priestia aryabhattai TaxID=412384 RepID=UPI003D26CED3